MTKEERREYNRIWYLNNQEKRKLQCKEYYEQCKDQVLATAKRYKAVNREEVKRRGREYYSKNKEKHRQYNIKYKYGISMEEYSKILESQDYECPICGCSLEGNGEIHIDHCHKTNTVRGILCRSCNLMLGHAKDNLDTLKGAIRYITRRTV